MPALRSPKTVEQIIKGMPNAQQALAKNLYLRGRDEGWRKCVLELEQFISEYPAVPPELTEAVSIFVKQGKEREDI